MNFRDTGLKDKNNNPIFVGDTVRLVLSSGEIRHFLVKRKTVIREVVNHPHFVGKTAKVSITGVVFNWRGYDLFPCVDENGIPDNEKMEVVMRKGQGND